MLFVGLAKVRAGTDQERVARRLEWDYPEGVTLIGEYWLLTNDPSVVFIVEAEDPKVMMLGIAQWDDVLDITYYPAVDSEEGIKFFKQAMS